jgi:hypothetical protein
MHVLAWKVLKDEKVVKTACATSCLLLRPYTCIFSPVTGKFSLFTDKVLNCRSLLYKLAKIFKMNTMKTTLVLISLLLSGLTLTAQNSVTLKLNLEKNKLYLLKSVSEQTVSQTVNGVQQNVDSDVEYTFSIKMLDKTPDFLVTEVRFDTLVTRTNTMGKMININSAVEGDIKSSETADIMSYVMNRLSKSALFVKIDFAGRPLEIVNSKMVSDMVVKDTALMTLTGPLAAALKTQIVSAVTDETLKTMIGTFTWCLPGKEVSTGDEWTVTQKVNSGGMSLDIINSYRLDAVDGNLARITSESQIKASENAAPIQSGGATVSYGSLQGLGKSEMVIDTGTGLIHENNVKTRISGNMDVSGPGFSMQIPLNINGESRVTAVSPTAGEGTHE